MATKSDLDLALQVRLLLVTYKHLLTSSLRKATRSAAGCVLQKTRVTNASCCQYEERTNSGCVPRDMQCSDEPVE